MNISHFDNMDSDSDSEVEGEEINQILYDIVTYKEWEQDPEVCRKILVFFLTRIRSPRLLNTSTDTTRGWAADGWETPPYLLYPPL